MNPTLYELIDQLNHDILKDHIEEHKNENLVFSPLSILILMSLLADSTEGITKEEIVKSVFRDTSDKERLEMMTGMEELLNSSECTDSANAVGVRSDLKNTIRDSYVKFLEEHYHGELFSSTDLAGDVNRWVSEKTHGMIKEIMDRSQNNILSVLMNALAFETEWKKQYEEDDIREDSFTNADHTESDVKMLESTEYGYIETESLTGFVKPYRKDYLFMGLLPKEEGQSYILETLSSLTVGSLKEGLTGEKVMVCFPEYKADQDIELTEYLKRKGIAAVFTNEADFSPMSSYPLKVDSIKHKSRIEVDRKGTKASAVTYAFLLGGAAPDMSVKRVYLNRPFLYMIIHEDTFLPVFVGLENIVH